MQDLPRHHTIRESSHRIINPLTPEQLRQLGDALFLPAGASMLDLACGKGEMLCTWARDHGIRGVGVDLSTVFLAAARARAVELGVSNDVSFIHADATGFLADEPVDVAACIGATWIGDGVPGSVELLRKNIKPQGLMLIGHPYWRQPPPDMETIRACGAEHESDWLPLPELIAQLQAAGCDVVEMILADQDSWDRYVAAQWRNIRDVIDTHPDDELTPAFRKELDALPVEHTRFQREYLGWGIFALRNR